MCMEAVLQLAHVLQHVAVQGVTEELLINSDDASDLLEVDVYHLLLVRMANKVDE